MQEMGKITSYSTYANAFLDKMCRALIVCYCFQAHGSHGVISELMHFYHKGERKDRSFVSSKNNSSL